MISSQVWALNAIPTPHVPLPVAAAPNTGTASNANPFGGVGEASGPAMAGVPD